MSRPGAEMPTSLFDSRYTERAKDLIALNKKIESLSHSSFELNIPKIVVIGDQSAGKSSLVEAISKIIVPRDGGTCTRCPMECTMMTESSWSCNLYLRKEFDSNGEPLPANKMEKVGFGNTITDLKELELWIRRAQAAILSPHREHSDFYVMTADTIKTSLNNDPGTLSFSRNIVGVEVKSPDSVPLTFVDLPGIIHHDPKNHANVELVHNLVKSVQNLVTYLSKLLANLIEANLTRLQKQVKTLVEKYQADLANFPLPPQGHPGTRMRRLIDQFSRAMHAVIMGESHRQEYAQKNRGIYSAFKEDIWKTGIEFTPYTVRDSSEWTSLHATDEAFNDNSVPQWEKTGRSFPKFQRKKNLDEVKAVINQSIGWELPGHVPFKATVELVRMSTSEWNSPTHKCFLFIFENSWKVFDSLIRDCFQNYDEFQKRVRTLTRNDSQKTLWKERFMVACNWRSPGQSYEYESELELMASVRAYWKVAFKRFIDDIPRLTEHQLNQVLDENLPEHLSDDISLDEAETLMAENPEIVENRTRLQALVRRLQELEQLVGTYTGEDLDKDDREDDDRPTSPYSPALSILSKAPSRSSTSSLVESVLNHIPEVYSIENLPEEDIFSPLATNMEYTRPSRGKKYRR